MALPDFEAWAMFAAVAEHRSFVGAARAIGVSTPTISKAIARLESSVGTMLFNRTSRRLALTQTGQRLAERAAKLVADAVETEECAREEVGAAQGTVKLAVPMSFGLAEIGPVIATFLAANPKVAVDLHLSDARVDLVGEGYDVALRIANLPDSSLRARTLRSVRRLVVASPGWVERIGTLSSPNDLPPVEFFGYTNQEARSPVILRHADGREAAIVPQGRLRANNGDVVIASVEAGLGVALSPDFIARAGIAAGRLVEVLPDWTPPPIGLHLITPPGRLRPRRVTVLIDHLVAAFQKN